MILPVILFYVYVLFVNFVWKKNVGNKFFFLFSYIYLFIIAIIRPDTMLDYQDYMNSFMEESPRMEPSFQFITYWIKKYGGDFIFLLAIYALIGIGLKLYVIKTYSILCGLSMLVYLSNYYLLHDLIQIRVSISAALFLMSLKYIVERRIYSFILLIIIATLFHFSSIILVLVYFINPYKINRVKAFFIMIVCYGLAICKLGIPFWISNVHIDVIQVAFNSYQNIMLEGRMEVLNIFNAVQLLRISIAVILLYKIDCLKSNIPMFALLIKIYVISISIYALFSEMPVIAVRLSELLGVVEILLIPILVFIFRNKKTGYIMVSLVSTVVLLMNIYYNNLLRI